MRTITYTVTPDCDGATVQDILRTKLLASDTSLRRAKSIPCGMTIDGIHARSIDVVHTGQIVGLVIDDAAYEVRKEMEPEEGSISVVYEDKDFIVLDKPADLVVHPSPGHKSGTLCNYVAHYFKQSGQPCQPHPVHRLDIGTTGLVVVTKNAYSQHRLQLELHTPKFTRTYLALCKGAFENLSGFVEEPIARLTTAPSTFGIHQDGKYAFTHYKVLCSFSLPGSNEAASLVHLQLQTGRTHQIRIHMAHLGHPLLGDKTYGEASDLIARPALHAWRTTLSHPVEQHTMTLFSKVPQDFKNLMPEACFSAIANEKRCILEQ